MFVVMRAFTRYLYILTWQASVDEFSAALQQCKDASVSVSITFYVFEIWKTSEQMASTENFGELFDFFTAKNAHMAALERMVEGAHALLVLSVSSSF